jgi:hypothetical protein
MKTIVASLVGGILIFIWQFMSWGLLDLHRPAQTYTENQTEILEFLGEKLPGDGGYFLPTLPAGSSQEDYEKMGKEQDGKPWAQIFYHQKMEMSMGMNMFRGFAVDVLMVFLLAWILGKFSSSDYSTTLMASMAVGLISIFNISYTNHIWFQSFDLNIHLLDALVSWGLVGLWLGWWLNRK